MQAFRLLVEIIYYFFRRKSSPSTRILALSLPEIRLENLSVYLVFNSSKLRFVVITKGAPLVILSEITAVRYGAVTLASNGYVPRSSIISKSQLVSSEKTACLSLRLAM